MDWWWWWDVLSNSLSGEKRKGKRGPESRRGFCQLLLFPRIIRLLSAVLLVIKELF